ncbi:MAG: hypothetical protein AB8E15_02505 [Bdellovibrionales bacterium]
MKSMALIAFLFFCMGLSANTNIENPEGFYRSCFGADYNPYGFEDCVNQNFREAQRDYGMPVRFCSSIEVNPYGFENCVNSNFRSVGRATGAFLRSCFWSNVSVGSFESCVNSNFRRLDR